MEKAQYAIMRFAKYKGPEIGNIEAHNERTKEKYASNPDVDTSRSKYNFHLVKPPGKYRAESERQIAAAGCRTRKDSIRMIETLFTQPARSSLRERNGRKFGFFRGSSALSGTASVQRDNYIRRGAYGRENAPYAPLFCPAYGGWQAQRQRHYGQQKEADLVAG